MKVHTNTLKTHHRDDEEEEDDDDDRVSTLLANWPSKTLSTKHSQLVRAGAKRTCLKSLLGKTQDASRHRGSERKEEKNGGGIEGGQCPGSQIKAHYLPSASAFQAPARIERRLTLQLSLSVIVQKAQAQDTDSQTDRQTESEKTAQCHSLSRGKLSRLDK
ncbi:hypothetical protein FQA47_011252 [Oryzias melastigma]|uniref:Uncharacterized protein n=1 Tax=Oryzias melastigma TaxID=30732 RepID=A0A834FBV0_ORYME|nr:hypothetical protein FQA47_011252 [Oryzias melastigma]